MVDRILKICEFKENNTELYSFKEIPKFFILYSLENILLSD